MTLLRAAGVAVSFGSRTLFQDLTLTLEEGERVGLVGPNGAGKSTLMKVLAGGLPPDRGELQLRRGAKVEYLPQEPSFPDGATVASELSVARGPQAAARAAHARLSAELAAADGARQEKLLAELAALADKVDHLGGWDTAHEARSLLDKLGVPDWDRAIAELSGGTRKRVAIARALLSGAELLLLDEPTNHLDAETVEWLEEAVDERSSGLLLVTHDRYFLDGLVDRIVELEPGKGVVSYPGNYQAYLEQKLVAEEQAQLARHKRDRFIAGEVAWLRKGVEARRTKSKARIERAQKLLAEKGHVPPKVAALQAAPPPRLGEVVFEVSGVSKTLGTRRLLDRVSLEVRRGEKLGIIGRNGAGKTTLLRLLLGELQPDEGTIVRGPSVKLAYYDQGREALDPEATIFEAAGGEEKVEVGGRVVSLRDFLDDLLFPIPMQKMQVKALSGGERNRLLLARTFLAGANVIVLDEPTNDLDIATLQVLEAELSKFGGTVIVVTHDRFFLDKVATATLALEGDGKVTRWPGGFRDYKTLKAQADAQAAREAAARAPAKAAAARPAEAPRKAPSSGGKLSYKEQRELDAMEAAIEAAETRKAAAEAALGDPQVYGSKEKAAAANAELEAATADVERLYARWQELQDKVA